MPVRQPRTTFIALAALATSAIVSSAFLPPTPAAAAVEIVSVDFSTSTGAVKSGATGMLYGLSDPGVPSDAVVSGVRPRTVTQMPEGGLQHPNGGAITVYDSFIRSGGTDIYINIQDQYPKWYYANAADPAGTYPGQTDYLEKVRAVVQKVKDTVPVDRLSRYVFTPFNEPDGGNWYADWTTRRTQFFADYDKAYDLIRSIIPGARIAADGASAYHENRVDDLLVHAQQTSRVPDVFTWHELSDNSLRDFPGHLAHFRSVENRLGIADLPVNITEYANRDDMGVPGQMIQWISMFENAKVDAQTAYWSYAGNLNDASAQTNGGNGSWWLMKWYADLSGNTAPVTVPRPAMPFTTQGVATLDSNKRIASILLGGGTADITVQLNGLNPTTFGSAVDVRVSQVGFSGQEGFAPQPPVVLAKQVSLSGGTAQITIPNNNSMNAFQVTVRSAGAVSPATTAKWSSTLEAENAVLAGGATVYVQNGDFTYAASGGRDVGNLGGAGASATWNVTVPRAGRYDLSVLYGTGQKPFDADPSLSSGRHALFVDGTLNQIVQYESTLSYLYRGKINVKVDLATGTHALSIRTSIDGQTVLPGSNLALDRFDLTDASTSENSTYPATEARTTGTTSIQPTMGTLGGRLTLAANSSAEYFLTAAEDGYYDLSIDWAAAAANSAIGLTLNGRDIAGLRSTATGQSRSVVTVHLAKGIQQLLLAAPTSRTVDLVSLTRNAAADSQVATIQAESSAVTRSAGVTTETPAAAYGSNVTGQYAGWLTAGRSITIPRPAGGTTGQYNLLVKYANADKFTGHPYNTDVITRSAVVTEQSSGRSVTGKFRHNYSYYSFWTQNVPLELASASSALTFGNPSGNAPNVDSFQLAKLVTAVTNSAR